MTWSSVSSLELLAISGSVSLPSREWTAPISWLGESGISFACQHTVEREGDGRVRKERVGDGEIGMEREGDGGIGKERKGDGGMEEKRGRV